MEKKNGKMNFLSSKKIIDLVFAVAEFDRWELGLFVCLFRGISTPFGLYNAKGILVGKIIVVLFNVEAFIAFPRVLD